MAEHTEERARSGKLPGSRALRWGVGVPAALVILLFGGSFFLDEPLRSAMEKRMNRHLVGYSVRLPGVHLNPLSLSLTLKGLTVLQQAHPDPPVVHFPVLKASIVWHEVLTGKLVAAFKLDSPSININMAQLRSQVDSKVQLKEQGWQQAVEDIYPLKINSVKISNASVTYVNPAPAQPLVMNHLNLQATNIRNIHSPDQVYPSSFHLDTAILGTGHATIDGAANFLGEPFPGIKGRVQLEKVPMDNLKPLTKGPNLSVHGGTLGALGEAEYSPKIRTAHLEKLTVQGMHVEYTHGKRTAALEKKRAVAVQQAAKKITTKPGLVIRADQVSLSHCTFGYVNNAALRPYRLFLADTDLELNNFSNQFAQGPARATLKAKFMGTGDTAASLDFRPAKEGRDLDLHLKIEETQMTALNDLLRDYGNFDVSAGVFSLVTELHIKGDTLSGYVKPFFRDMQVYDSRKDKGSTLTHKMYEILVGGAAKILQNRPRQEVATKVIIKGSLKNPETSTWQIIGQLFKNAFFKALVPSFDK